MRSLYDLNNRIRLWFDGRTSCLVDIGGNPVAIIKGEVVHNLRCEPVASWKWESVFDLDGKMLLKKGLAEDGPGPRLVPLSAKPRCDTGDIRPQARKPWGSELAFVETLRLVSRDYRLNGLM